MTTTPSSQESPLAYTPSKRLSTVLDYINGTPGLPGAKSVTQDGKPTISVGQGGLEARVYRPTTEEQATRNLNFAIANLEAYVDWDKRGREAQAKAELEAKRKAELEAAQARLKEVRLKNGLELYNKLHNARALSWGYLSHITPAKQEEWADYAEALAKLQRSSNPYSFGGISPSLIVDGSIRASSLYANSLRF